ncbi:MAG: DUF4328 domain-containing protein [Verrucomicrobiaceae bacterium]|nr:MAG: DUF4328 domain-containing protein [Verrucomicrobiaceae bacterium]
MENPYQPPASSVELPAMPVGELKNPRKLALVAVGLYGISLVAEIGDFLARKYLEKRLQHIHEQFDTAASGPGLLEWVMLVLGLASAVVYLIWKYRAAVNARILDASAMTVSPAMAVGSYFIPFVFFVVPYRAMAQIARVTLGNASGVGLWWACHIGMMLLGMAIGFHEGLASPSAWAGLLGYLSLAVSVITFLISAWLVMKITRVQAARCAP